MEKYSEKLRDQYKTEIKSWDWDKIRENAVNNPAYEYDGVMISGSEHLDTFKELTRDQAFMEALEAIADDYCMFIVEDSGNLYAKIYLEDTLGCFFYCEKDRNHFETGFYREGELMAYSGKELKALMEKEDYFPYVFTESDHGYLDYCRDWETIEAEET